MPRKNAFYAQSGGVTAVINASACGVIETARKNRSSIGRVYAGRNGIIGALREDLIDTSKESTSAIRGLASTPAGAFGSCRFKLKGLEENRAEYERLIEVFQAHNIGYFFYNGGGDSADTCLKVSQLSESMGYPLQAIHIPKTIDNDLPLTDCCPGFGSVAKYVAISTREAAMDVASMCETSTKVFILEVMGRHAGWIAAAAGLAAEEEGDAPHIILFPEIAFNRTRFLARVEQTVKRQGYCVIVASEGTQYEDGTFLTESGLKDAFGHSHSARHIASLTDVKQAYDLGEAAVEMALQGKNAIMPCIVRGTGKRYRWTIGEAPLKEVANREKKMPRGYITRDGFGITDDARKYLAPLITGESHPEYHNGLPRYVKLKNVAVPRKLDTDFEV
jgi:6-phosphofructokinase 1